MTPSDTREAGTFCLRFDIDTNFTPWRRNNFCSRFGEDEPRFILRLLDWLRERNCRAHFFAMGFGVIDYGESLRQIAQSEYPLDSHLHTHRVTLLDDYNAVYEEMMTAHHLLASIGARIEGIGATGMYPEGIDGRPDIQELILQKGYRWVSSRWNLTRTLEQMQPYRLPTGLLEIPCAGWSDMTFFHINEQRALAPEYQVERYDLSTFTQHVKDMITRAGRGKLDYAICLHPAVLALHDPEMTFLEQVTAHARAEGVELVDLRQVHQRHAAVAAAAR
ncbi:MAG: hypothetical protein BWZ08_01953 [candidate division BRC1 bacterium ADurb.BinA292]|nr:MAG: hypothetical protein BWZ08_01953 [candidate division BRC1 bacterium ADurb.BinA292]